MVLFIHRSNRAITKGMVAMVIIVVIFVVGFTGSYGFAAKTGHMTFKSPDEAFSAAVGAMKAGDEKQLHAIFGPHARELFGTDDGINGENCQRFLKAYEEQKRIEDVGANKVVLHVGKDDWPWPLPVVKTGPRWKFDAQAGIREIVARRIGRNETAAVQVCLAYVDAQHEYARDHRTAKGLGEYAQKFGSDDGKKDGLCWEAKNGEKESPLGPEIVNACKSAYTRTHSGSTSPTPYHGYFYKILNRQGKAGPGGAYEYILDGKMIGGFALVAYPASYGSSGIMTFIVNQDGAVYEKDLGKDTGRIADNMGEFNPDKTWTKVD